MEACLPSAFFFMEKHVALACNPTTDNSKALRVTDEVGLHLKKRGISCAYYTTNWPDNYEFFSDVWIIGGDGTLNFFLNKYPNIKKPLSVFPAGSGNDFHNMLYGDLTIAQQVERILVGTTKHIDAGTCNGKLFINGVGIGFDGAIVKALLGKRKLAGKASYLLAVLKNIISYKEQACHLYLNDRHIEEDVFMVSVTNGRSFGGGFLVTPNAMLDDALLDVNLVGRVPPLQRLKYLPVIERGDHLELPFVQSYKTSKVLINCPIDLHAHLDGEYLTSNSFEIECLPAKFLFSV